MLLAAWDASLRRQREHRFLTALLQGMLSTKPTSDMSLLPKAALLFAAAAFFTRSSSPSDTGRSSRSCLTQISHFTNIFKAHDGKMQCSGDFGFLSLWAEHHLPSLVSGTTVACTCDGTAACVRSQIGTESCQIN